jgi:(1->4)-alpha-D-glucan 1-alpha-D-glucosylmutase
LNNPSGYLQRLRRKLGRDCYIIAEKILEAKEEMPEHWPLEGTSGYEFLFFANQLFTNRRGTGKLVEFYHSLLPGMPSYEDIVLLNKRLILNAHMAGELENIVDYFFELRLQSDFSRERVRGAISLFMLSLPVYRIYPDKLPLRGKSLDLIKEAIEKAMSLDAGYSTELSYLLTLCLAGEEDVSKRDIIRFLRRLMQFTGPLTAKGVEDTTFYIYNPLISHVEVGDAPSTLGISIQQFHRSMIRRQQTTPYSLNATATHDTKRGEDARLRLNAISDIPDLWIETCSGWIELNKGFRKKINGKDAPILNDEYFIYQSIVGGFPEDNEANPEWVNRLKQYMVKVVREAKIMSDWSEPNQEYEDACASFIESILGSEDFMKSFRSIHAVILAISARYSIAQTVLKITAPGIPDIYQGCELFDLSYVDPDNRRPVDYDKRREFLEYMSRPEKQHSEIVSWLDTHSGAGAPKMFAIHKLLELRRRKPELFSQGSYVPLTLTGHGELAAGYARYYEESWCIVVLSLGQFGKNNTDSVENAGNFISLPANSPIEWRNIFTGEPVKITNNEIPLQELMQSFPVGVLSNF